MIVDAKGNPAFEKKYEDMGVHTKLLVNKEGISILMRGQSLILQALSETKGVSNGTREKIGQWLKPHSTEGTETKRADGKDS